MLDLALQVTFFFLAPRGLNNAKFEGSRILSRRFSFWRYFLERIEAWPSPPDVTTAPAMGRGFFNLFPFLRCQGRIVSCPVRAAGARKKKTKSSIQYPAQHHAMTIIAHVLIVVMGPGGDPGSKEAAHLGLAALNQARLKPQGGRPCRDWLGGAPASIFLVN